MDGQEDDFCTSCIIMMNRNNTRIVYITQTGIGFSVTKKAFYTDSSIWTSEQKQSRLVSSGDEYLVSSRDKYTHEIIFPSVF